MAFEALQVVIICNGKVISRGGKVGIWVVVALF